MSNLNSESVSVFDESNVALEGRGKGWKKVSFAFFQSEKKIHYL